MSHNKIYEIKNPSRLKPRPGETEAERDSREAALKKIIDLAYDPKKQVKPGVNAITIRDNYDSREFK